MHVEFRIALVGYPAAYFQSFASALGEVGFEVFWITSLRSEAKALVENFRVDPAKVLDLSFRDSGQVSETAIRRAQLQALETGSAIRINDIILMDRIVRHKPYDDAIAYLDYVRELSTNFLESNQIQLVSSGRDTAMQLINMLVCKHLDIPWVVPTRLRIPVDTYGFCAGHETFPMLQLKEAEDGDRDWAASVVEDFRDRKQKPALKVAAQDLRSTLRLLVPHFKLFADLLTRSVIDRGNDYSRYTIPKILKMYLARRFNMLIFKAVKPYSVMPEGDICVYALHTQPESSIDVAASAFSDQVALVTHIARALPAACTLVVKIHPTDIDGKTLAYYRRISSIPGVLLIHDQVQTFELIMRARIVFTLAGTIGYEAGLLGFPVVTFARNYYNELPSVHYCSSPVELVSLVTSLLEERGTNDHEPGIIEFLTRIRSSVFDGEVNRAFGSRPTTLNSEDLHTLQEAYLTLKRRLVDDGPDV